MLLVWKKLGDFALINLITLLLRFSSIIFLVSIPILSADNPELLHATSLVGLTSLLVIVGTLLSKILVRMLLRWVWLIDLLSGLFFPIVLLVPALRAFPLVYTLFAVLLGFAVAGTEAASMMLVVDKPTREVLAKRLSLFNGLRVVGMALGLLLGGLSAAGTEAVRVVTVLLALASLVQMVLGGLAFTRFYHRDITSPAAEAETPEPKVVRSLSSLGLFVADVTVFSFWYSFIPYALKAAGESARNIGLYLAIQALSHAIGQSIWKRIVISLGELPSFFMSLAAHVTIVYLIVRIGGASFLIYSAMFVAMGLLNSGTYLASTVWYYATGYPRSRNVQVGLHQAASNLGKWLGASIAILWIR